MKIKQQQQNDARSQRRRRRFWASWLLATVTFGAVLYVESRNRQNLALATALAILEVPVPSSMAMDIDDVHIDGIERAAVASSGESISDSSSEASVVVSEPSVLPSSCPLSSTSSPTTASSFLSHTTATQLIHDYANATIQNGQKPRFPPILQKLLEKASADQEYFVTVQIGGMDGKTGDPLYRMTELYKGGLSYWVPVVLEPVPSNFAKLQETYRTHEQQRNLHCPLLLNSLISYTQNDNDATAATTCDFCHFDDASTNPACHDLPSFLKSEIGSMDCSRDVVAEEGSCFTKSQLKCGTVERALQVKNNVDTAISSSSSSMLSENVMVLQVDVEGFEQQVLEGFIADRSKLQLPLPPVIHFESRILKARGQLDAVYALLRSKGYSIHEKRVDTLCLLGFQGPETSVP